MDLKLFTGLKKLAIITVTILGFLGYRKLGCTGGSIVSTAARIRNSPNKIRVVVAQSETRTTTEEKTGPSSESSASESKTQEKKESAGTQEKPP